MRIIAIGRDGNGGVYCDCCARDYSNSYKRGGLIFGSKAVCPECEPTILELAKNHGGQKHIKEFCLPEMSFKDWIYLLRRREP